MLPTTDTPFIRAIFTVEEDKVPVVVHVMLSELLVKKTAPRVVGDVSVTVLGGM